MSETRSLPTAEDKRAALDEVLRSRTFERATQLQKFLRFVCEMELAGRAGELSEYVIGVEALGRRGGYSPAEDSVVRRRAIDLREKLQEVYGGELAAARVRIELPKGRYVPRFVHVTPEPPPASLAAVTNGRAARWVVVPAAALFLAGVAVGGLAVRFARAPVAPRPPDRGTSYEAERPSHAVSGGVVRDRCAACSGGARVRNVGRGPANSVAFRDVYAPAAGPSLLTIHYLLDGRRSLFVRVNDGPAQELPLKGDSWAVPATVTVVAALEAGRNTITLFNDHAVAPDIDRIVVW